MADPRSLAAAQVFVGLLDPVFARRIEDIEIDGVFQGLGLVRHVARDEQDLAGFDNDDLAVDPEFQSAFEDVGDLLVLMAVLGNDAAFFEQDAGEHHIFADHEVTLEERVQILERDGLPGDVLERGFA